MLPCPFCESEAVEVVEKRSEAYVVCRECYAQGPISDDGLTQGEPVIASAIRKWDKPERSDPVLPKVVRRA